jgi:hypothetical protein
VVERLQSGHVAIELTAEVLGEMENIDPGELIGMVRQLKRALETQQT